MNARREKYKQQQAQLNKQLEPVAVKAKKEHPVAKKMGDFFIDVAKLIIGGVILAGLMKQDIDYWSLVIGGAIAIVLFILLGMYLINKSN